MCHLCTISYPIYKYYLFCDRKLLPVDFSQSVQRCIPDKDEKLFETPVKVAPVLLQDLKTCVMYYVECRFCGRRISSHNPEDVVYNAQNHQWMYILDKNYIICSECWELFTKNRNIIVQNKEKSC